MKPAVAELFVKEMKAAGIDLVVGLPDSGMYQIIKRVREDGSLQYLPVTNEGEGAGICGGAWMGGRKPILLMENSGLRVASETLARLGISFGIPVLMLMSYRGEIGDGNWWAVNHGVVMEPLLKALRIPYTILRRTEEIGGAIQRARKNLQGAKYHYDPWSRGTPCGDSIRMPGGAGASRRRCSGRHGAGRRGERMVAPPSRTGNVAAHDGRRDPRLRGSDARAAAAPDHRPGCRRQRAHQPGCPLYRGRVESAEPYSDRDGQRVLRIDRRHPLPHGPRDRPGRRGPRDGDPPCGHDPRGRGVPRRRGAALTCQAAHCIVAKVRPGAKDLPVFAMDGVEMKYQFIRHIEATEGVLVLEGAPQRMPAHMVAR